MTGDVDAAGAAAVVATGKDPRRHNPLIFISTKLNRRAECFPGNSPSGNREEEEEGGEEEEEEGGEEEEEDEVQSFSRERELVRSSRVSRQACLAADSREAGGFPRKRSSDG